MDKKYDRQFFSRGFFRSTNWETYTWISLLWNYSKQHPQLGIFYNNSWLKFTPHQIFNIWELKNLLSYLKNPRWTYLYNKLSLRIEEWEWLLNLSEKNDKYEFLLSAEELFMFRVYIVYCINYIESSKNIDSVSKINVQIEKIIKEHLHSKENITLSEYNNSIFKDNLVKNLDWEYTKIPIPSIEHEFHWQKNWVKTGYYFKLFPEYIKILRDSTEKETCNNTERYPIQVIVQEWGISDIVNFTEIELYKLLNYLEAILYQKDIKESGNVSKNGEFSLSMTNEYKWKKYLNKDTISKEDYNELKEYLEIKDSESIKNKIKLLKINKKLISNKYTDDTTLKTLDINANTYTNFSISRSSLEWVNEDSWIFQLWNISWNRELTLNIVKWNIWKWWKQYLSVCISEKDILELICKIKAYLDILNTPINFHLNKLYKNIETLKYLDLDNDFKIPENLLSLFIWELSDSKFLKKNLIKWEESELSISVFTPNILKQLNTSLFVLKNSLEWLQDERYPITLQVNKAWERLCYFSLWLWWILLLIHKLLNWEKFSIDAKNWKYKRLEIYKDQDNVVIKYYEASSLYNLDTSTEIFSEVYIWENIINTIKELEKIMKVWIKNLLIKSIIYTNNYLKYERKICKG